MKAKDYYQKYVNLEPAEGPSWALAKVMEDFTFEIDEIRKTRQAKTDEALASILREQEQKWQALTKMILSDNSGKFKADKLGGAFREMIQQQFPILQDLKW